MLAHPIPDVWLVFVRGEKSASKVTVELPSTAKAVLVDCWKAELAHYYKRAFEQAGLAQRINEKNTLGWVNSSVLSRLETMTIDSPTGRRKISWDEAGDLVRVMADAAQEVIEQAKESAQTKPLA